MPSSGARSGTKPSHAERGAGSGRVGPTKLECGHVTHATPVASGGTRGNRWFCPQGCDGLKVAA